MEKIFGSRRRRVRSSKGGLPGPAVVAIDRDRLDGLPVPKDGLDRLSAYAVAARDVLVVDDEDEAARRTSGPSAARRSAATTGSPVAPQTPSRSSAPASDEELEVVLREPVAGVPSGPRTVAATSDATTSAEEVTGLLLWARAAPLARGRTRRSPRATPGVVFRME
jgi:hypothetical protein